jgi:hypothetical protein
MCRSTIPSTVGETSMSTPTSDKHEGRVEPHANHPNGEGNLKRTRSGSKCFDKITGSKPTATCVKSSMNFARSSRNWGERTRNSKRAGRKLVDVCRVCGGNGSNWGKEVECERGGTGTPCSCWGTIRGGSFRCVGRNTRLGYGESRRGRSTWGKLGSELRRGGGTRCGASTEL